MNRHKKNGLISMTIWILFLAVVFGSYMLITKQPITCFIDKETGGFISGLFFVVWAFIWFGIGRHYSIDYEAKKISFMENYSNLDKNLVCKTFRKAYFANIARILAKVFFVSVPFYVAANVNVKDSLTLKNCVFIGALTALSIVCYGYYKKNHIKDIKL